jgi:hypothetical protein
MRSEKQKGFVGDHLAGFIVFSAYFLPFGLDSAWRALS